MRENQRSRKYRKTGKGGVVRDELTGPAYAKVGVGVLAVLILAACSGSGSPKTKQAATATTASTAGPAGSTPTSVTGLPPTSATSTVASTVAGPTTTLTPAQRQAVQKSVAAAVPLPPTACLMLTSQAAAALVGPVRSTATGTTGSTSTCSYVGASGQAKLSVTAAGDVGAAHTQFIQAERAAGTSARGAFIGDEAFTYPGGMTSRVGKVLLTLTGTPAPSSAELETAIATVAKQI